MNGITITPEPARATTSAGDPKVIVYVRQEIKKWFTKPHTRAIALCLYLHAECPRMSVPEICEWLDEYGMRTKEGCNHEWARRSNEKKASTQKMVSEVRDVLRGKPVPFNE